MKATRQSVNRAVDQPSANLRFYLFHGPDEGQSRGLAQRLLAALGASKLVLSAGSVKSDPAILVDQSAAMSLFGGVQLIWIEPAGEEIVEGVQSLLAADAVQNPAIAIAGALRKTSNLLKLAEVSPRALTFAAYLPDGADAERMVSDLGRSAGLKISGSVARRIAEAAGNDQALVAQELQKFALYLDASPQSPKELEQDAIDAVGLDLSEGDLSRLADLALLGRVDALAGELARLPALDAIPTVRSLQRRLAMLMPVRARIERGESPDAVMTSMGKSLFWKDKPVVERIVTSWDAEGLERVAERAGQLERALMFTKVPGEAAVGQELLAIALQARRR